MSSPRRKRAAGPQSQCARPASRGPLEDELALLRAQVRRLAARLELEAGSGDELKLLHTMTEMIRAIATLERSRKDLVTETNLPQVMAGADPTKEL